MPNNSREAVHYFRTMQKRHKGGAPDGTRALAHCYLCGHGVQQSVEKAVSLLRTLDFDSDPVPAFEIERYDQLSAPVPFSDVVRSNFRMMDNLPLPIAGGWGYSKDDPVEVDLALDLGYEEDRPFDLGRLEHMLMENRIYYECVMRPSDRLAGIEWKIEEKAAVVEDDGRRFDKIVVGVRGCPEWVWDSLGHDWMMARRRTPRSKTEAHEFMRQWFSRKYRAEFWFDITACPEDQGIRHERGGGGEQPDA